MINLRDYVKPDKTSLELTPFERLWDRTISQLTRHICTMAGCKGDDEDKHSAGFAQAGSIMLCRGVALMLVTQEIPVDDAARIIEEVQKTFLNETEKVRKKRAAAANN